MNTAKIYPTQLAVNTHPHTGNENHEQQKQRARISKRSDGANKMLRHKNETDKQGQTQYRIAELLHKKATHLGLVGGAVNRDQANGNKGEHGKDGREIHCIHLVFLYCLGEFFVRSVYGHNTVSFTIVLRVLCSLF